MAHGKKFQDGKFTVVTLRDRENMRNHAFLNIKSKREVSRNDYYQWHASPTILNPSLSIKLLLTTP